MRVTQISVFLENRPGRLLRVLEVLAGAKVNLQALSVADTSDFGVVRVIVDDTDAAASALRSDGLTISRTEVLCAEIPDEPGGLANSVVAPLSEAGVNVEYVYAYSQRLSGHAVVVLKVSDLEKAEQALAGK
jgi:hypothetical protein